MLNCCVLAALVKTITWLLLLPAFHIRVAVAILTPHPCPLPLCCILSVFTCLLAL